VLVYGAGYSANLELLSKKLMTAKILAHKTMAQLRRHRHFLNGNILEYSVVAILFALLTCIFTAWVVLDMNNKLFVEGEGDGTSGFLWLNYADQDLNPKPGYTTQVNYPEGANLGNPTFITYTALWAPMWVLSHVFTPLVALNLVTLWGFFSGAFFMYWLMKRLTGNMWVAFFAGFAVAFVPYHIVKSSAHLAYIFSGVFVLITAAFIGFWRKQTFWRAVILAATLALAYYTDGYFLLLASALIGTLLLGGLLYDICIRGKNFWKQLSTKIRYLILAGVALLVFIAPIIFVQLKYGDDVSSGLAQSRGDSGYEIAYYAAQPIDYLIPPMRHIYLRHIPAFNDLQAAKNTRSNASESTLYIGLIILFLCAVGIAMLIAYWREKKGQSLSLLTASQRRTFLFIACLVAVSVPILISITLPPWWVVAGHRIPLPAGAFIEFGITFWRVLARLFIPIHVLIVLFASLSLWVVLQQAGKKLPRLRRELLQAAVVLVLLGILSFEYATTFSRPPFDFNNLPPAYTWLKQQKDVKAIVEFPLVSKPWDQATTAVTAQMIHNKSLVNLHLPQQELGRRNGLVNISNPEAADYAYDRGARIAVTHDEKCSRDYPWLKLAYDGGKDKPYRLVCMYWLSPASNDKLFVNLKTGFADVPSFTKGDPGYYNMLYGNYAELWVMNENDIFVTKPTPAAITMELANTPGYDAFNGTWRILQEEKEITTGSIIAGKAQTIGATIDASKPVQLRIDGPDGLAPAIYQMNLTKIKITAQ
jgi:hypothetical protein